MVYFYTVVYMLLKYNDPGLLEITTLLVFQMNQKTLNPIALRKAKIVCNFGLSECNRVKLKL